MSVIGSNVLAGASGGAGAADFQIDRSLRFNDDDSAYLNRTPSSAGNRKIWTWSGWVKRCSTGSYQTFFSSYHSAGNYHHLRFRNDEKLEIRLKVSSTDKLHLITEQVFRDFSAWYHIVFAYDSTQSTASNRGKLYINGSQVTDFSTETYPPQNEDSYVANANAHYIGQRGDSYFYHNGYLAEVHFIDGQALAPTDFGEYDDNNVWQPKEVNITGPNNGTTWSNGGNDSDLAAGSWANVFNGASSGDHGTTSTVASEQGSGNSATITFSPAISGVIDVVMSAAASAGSIDGGVALSDGTSIGVTTHSGSPKLESFGSKTNITSLTLNAGSNGGCSISEIRLDGVPLIDGDSTNIGVNGFHLNFSDTSSNAALGTDSSDLSNTWTVNNLLVVNANGNYVPDLAATYDGPLLAFDGNTSTRTRAATGGQPLAFTPTGIAYTSSIEVWDWLPATTTYWTVNGGTAVYSPNSGNQWVTVATGSGTLTNLTNYTSGRGGHAAIRIDGTVLVDYRAQKDDDSLIDTPTDYEAESGNNGGNYATLNPLDSASNQSASNGNLEHRGTNTSYGILRSTFGVASGKWYWEGTVVGVDAPDGTAGLAHIGITTSSASLSSYIGSDAYGWMYNFDALKFNNNSSSSYGNTYVTGDIIGVALDMDAGTLTFYKNGTSQNQAFSGLSGTIFPSFSAGSSGAGWNVNFGQRAFAYSAPSGYKALCTTNLPTPTIENPSDYFDVALDTGANILSSTKALCNNGANFLWIKDRDNNSTNHHLIDILRDPQLDGTPYLSSNVTDTESQLGTYSAPSGNSVGWAWSAGTSTVSNTDGSITAQVRANASAGFSLISWSASTQSTATIGHGLGKQPDLIFAKSRNNGDNWYVFEPSLDTGGSISRTLYLNDSTDKVVVSAVWGHWDEMTSTTFGITDSSGSGTNNGNMIAYCFTSVDQFSRFGVYYGNGDSNGPFVYTGFQPAFLLIKRTDSPSSWYIFDSARSTYNVVDNRIRPHVSNQEDSNAAWNNDFLSNGFKLRTSEAELNQLSSPYIYAAFAEHPFKTARAR